jgi:Uma2 family endonuclease
MVLAVQVLATYRFTTDEYHRLRQAGILDEGPKLEAYARGGVREVWVIDAVRRRIFVHRNPNQGRYQFSLETRGDDVLTVVAFPDITFPVSAILSS